MTSATDILALRKQAMEGKTQAKPSDPAKPKPVERTVRFSVEVENAHTGETERYNLQSTIHRDLDGAIDRMSRSIAGAPLGEFLPEQQDRFLQIARCVVQLDNFDLSKKLMTQDEAFKLEGLLLDSPPVRIGIFGRLVEHHRRFRYGDRASVQSGDGQGGSPAKAPIVVVGEFDAPNADRR